jgi:hypothetical protein
MAKAKLTMYERLVALEKKVAALEKKLKAGK